VILEGVGHAFDLTSWQGRPLPLDLRAVVLGFLRQYVGVPAHGSSPIPPPPPRVCIDLDGAWRFYPADNIHGPETGFDDSSWRTVDVPHTWNARDGEDGGDNYRRGVSWYRRHVRLDPSLAGRRLYLQFDGVSLMADVYVNGTHIGAHKGGFARFRVDATDALRAGEDNLISVRVDNGTLGIPPVSADFTFFGGIYRSVSLLATHQIQISTMDYGSPGVYVDQDQVTAQFADLTVRTEVESYAYDKETVEVRAHLYDAAGAEVASAANKGKMNGGDAVEERQRLILRNPHLWNGKADPYLYTLRVDIVADKALVDSVTQPVGLRFFRVDPERGFFLNGRPLDLHGVNRYQDRLDKGWAISPADEAEDFDLLRELGCTALRASHYQQSDTWYQRCDRAGIVVWAEIPFVNEAPAAPEFLDNAKQQLRELIRQNYNHPSICFWGVGNEARGDPADGAIAALADVARAQDPFRLSAYASNAAENDTKNWHTDVVGFDHYAGWYTGDLSELPAWLDRVHRLHPHSPFGVSEYGAGASIFEHEEPPVRPPIRGPFHPEEYQSALHEASWPALAARPYLWCKFVWCLFDFASDARHEGGQPGRNDMGLVTYDRRIRKDAYYWYKANWSGEPVVWIASRRFLVRHVPLTEVKVYSNAPEIELFVDGKSAGVQRSAGRLFRWPRLTLHPGENHVAATARFGSLSCTDACTWLYAPPARKKS
jgi:beta-galactosidase